MPFSAEDFITNVSWEAFDELKKPELMALTQYLDLQNYKSSMLCANKK